MSKKKSEEKRGLPSEYAAWAERVWGELLAADRPLSVRELHVQMSEHGGANDIRWLWGLLDRWVEEGRVERLPDYGRLSYVYVARGRSHGGFDAGSWLRELCGRLCSSSRSSSCSRRAAAASARSVVRERRRVSKAEAAKMRAKTPRMKGGSSRRLGGLKKRGTARGRGPKARSRKRAPKERRALRRLVSSRR